MAEGKYDDQITAMQVQITQLLRENQKMQTALAEVANANVLPRVLENGFADVIAQLKPLRDLTPQRESVDPRIAEAAAAMLEAMEGVPLSGDSLGIRPINVPYIGQPRTPVPGTPGTGEHPYPGQPDPYKPDTYVPDPYKTDPSKTEPSKTDPYRPDPYKSPDQTIPQQPPRGGYRS